MDPDACLERLQDAIVAADWPAAFAASDDLAAWIQKGGFVPGAPSSLPDSHRPRAITATLALVAAVRYAQQLLQKQRSTNDCPFGYPAQCTSRCHKPLGGDRFSCAHEDAENAVGVSIQDEATGVRHVWNGIDWELVP